MLYVVVINAPYTKVKKVSPFFLYFFIVCTPIGTLNFVFQSRPLTCYLPNASADFDLRTHLESLGHDLDGISSEGVIVDMTSCRGFLLKKSGISSSEGKKSPNVAFGMRGWKKRWFVLDRKTRQLEYCKSICHQTTSKKNIPTYLPPVNTCVPFTALKEVNEVII